MKVNLIAAAAAVALNLAGVSLSNLSVVQADDAVTQITRPCGSRKPAGTTGMPRRNKHCRTSAPRQRSTADSQAERYPRHRKGA